jgi:hypothetical protein
MTERKKVFCIAFAPKKCCCNSSFVVKKPKDNECCPDGCCPEVVVTLKRLRLKCWVQAVPNVKPPTICETSCGGNGIKHKLLSENMEDNLNSGIMTTPAVKVNGELVVRGYVPSAS